MFPQHLLVVRATIDPAHEEEFNRWYNEEHVPDALRLAGCVGAARYRVLGGDDSHQYVAVYAFEDEASLHAAMTGDYRQELVRRYDAAFGKFSNRSRAAHCLIFESYRWN